MIWHIARREWLEQRRQPVMLVVIASLYGLVALLVGVGLGALDFLARDPARMQALAGLGGQGDPAAVVESLAGSAIGMFTFLVFSQFLGIASVLSGHTVLHDRQCGTLMFLLLARVRRLDLLAGKVLGAVGWSLALYLVIDGLGAVAIAALPVSAPHAAWLPTSPGWWVVFALGGPAWALFIGAICTVISSLAHDVRTAQQGVWFVVFFATLGSGGLLTWSLTAGLAAQLATVALALTGAAGTLVVGSQLMSRDVR